MTDDTQDQAANHLPAPKAKDPAAVALGRKGGLAGRGASQRRTTAQCRRAGRKGAKAAFAAMTPEQRTARARKANQARQARRKAAGSAGG